MDFQIEEIEVATKTDYSVQGCSGCHGCGPHPTAV